MKRRDLILILLTCIFMTGTVLFAKLNARLEEQLQVVYHLEALISPTDHTFSMSERNQLTRWLNGYHARLERARARPFSPRSKIDDALRRLNECKAKLTKSETVEQQFAGDGK